jgi:hypothetical protein
MYVLPVAFAMFATAMADGESVSLLQHTVEVQDKLVQVENNTAGSKVAADKYEYTIKNSGACEDDGYETVVDLDGCLNAIRGVSGDDAKGWRFDQPEGGYTTSSTGRTRGCTLHGGSTGSDGQFFPNAQGDCGTANFHCVCRKISYEYKIKSSGTCEDDGYETVVDLNGCLDAIRGVSGDSSKGWRFDQPDGGYTTSSSGRTRGCTLHGGSTGSDGQFFPNAQGDCGTANFHCVCRKAGTYTPGCFSPAIGGKSPGSSLGSSSKDTLEDCQSACNDDSGCLAITYRAASGACWQLARTYDSKYTTATDDCVVANKGTSETIEGVANCI